MISVSLVVLKGNSQMEDNSLEDNSLEDNSPLQFLDMDCSRYLYETYYPSDDSTQAAGINELCREFVNHIRGYTANSFYRRYRRY